jgi:hypothetical protein
MQMFAVGVLLAAAVYPTAFLAGKREPEKSPGVVRQTFLAKQRCDNGNGGVSRHKVDGHFPRLAGTSEVARSINRTIEQEVARLVLADNQCTLPVAANSAPGPDGEISVECEVQLRNEQLFTVTCEGTRTGHDFGAHPQGESSSLVFDLLEGTRLRTGDLLVSSGAESNLRTLIRKNLDIAGMVAPEKLSDREIGEMVDVMMKNCYLDGEGLTCQQYYWPVTVFTSVMTFEELPGIIKPELIRAARAK